MTVSLKTPYSDWDPCKLCDEKITWKKNVLLILGNFSCNYCAYIPHLVPILENKIIKTTTGAYVTILK